MGTPWARHTTFKSEAGHPPLASGWSGCQLATVHSYRASEDGAPWSIFGHSWAANAVFLVALVATGHAPDPPWGIVICVIGAVVSFAWWLLQTRGLYHIVRSERIIESAEGLARLRQGLRFYGEGAPSLTDGRWYSLTRNSLAWGAKPLCSARRAMQVCAFAVFLAWTCGAVLFATIPAPGTGTTPSP
ncbi:MAG: hypothetical protein FJ254_09455 [Phycisphaerae bacterium]|nr:hypothetical protein [Phycisphaerae bacterium]